MNKENEKNLAKIAIELFYKNLLSRIEQAFLQLESLPGDTITPEIFKSLQEKNPLFSILYSPADTLQIVAKNYSYTDGNYYNIRECYALFIHFQYIFKQFQENGQHEATLEKCEQLTQECKTIAIKVNELASILPTRLHELSQKLSLMEK